MKNSRLIAFDILQSILRENAYSNLALEKGIVEVESKDKAFVSKLVYGVIERKLTLDYAINSYLESKTKPKVMTLLYMGAYQILYMDRVPDGVAVYETVELANSLGLSFYKKLINAVLHKIIDNKNVILSSDDLIIKYSCPEHLINMWKKMYGQENTISILESINERPPVFAIPNNKYVDAEELQYELFDSGIDCEVYNDVVKINSSFDINSLKAFKDGLFYIEDYSSYVAAKELNAQENDIVLDICAAPGGKSFTIAQSGCELYSYDLHSHRVELIKNSANRLGFQNINVDINDALIFNDTIPKANKVLCDVPCSGFGIIRRKPEIRYKNLDEIKELSQIQFDILNTSAKYLLINGYIMYSTCTLNKKENEQIVSKFLELNNNFELIKEVTTFPSIESGDGFFYALMKKIND